MRRAGRAFESRVSLAATLLLSATSALQTVDYAAVLETFQQQQDVPGIAAAVVVGDRAVFVGGTGLSSLETRGPVTADTVFYLGSVSKVLTALLVLGMAEDGLMALDEDLEFRAGGGSSIAPAEILSHTSGLPREGPFGYWFTADFPQWPALIEFAGNTPLDFEPGSRTAYSNVGYAVLGGIAARRLNLSFDAAIRQRLLEPLNMRHTGSIGPAPEVARGYTPPGRLLPSAERPFAGVGARAGDRYVREYHDARAMAPAFGMYSSAADMAKLLSFIVSTADSPAPSETERKKLYVAQASGRGLGMQPDSFDGRPIARHSGWFAAHRSHMLVDPRPAIGIVVLTNGDNARPARIAEALLELARSEQPTSGSP